MAAVTVNDAGKLYDIGENKTWIMMKDVWEELRLERASDFVSGAVNAVIMCAIPVAVILLHLAASIWLR